MKKWHLWIAAALSMASSPIATAWAGAAVVLRLKDTGFEFSGELKSFDGSKYVVAAPAFGVLSLDAARFDCEGEACGRAAGGTKFETSATASPAPSAIFTIEANAGGHQTFAIDGSATIGHELMPQLIRDYASSLGGAAKQIIGGASGSVRFKITDARGSELSDVELRRRSSTDAFGALIAGRADIGMSSRPISASEAAAMPAMAGGVHGAGGEVVLALDALAVLVAPGNPAASISMEALAKVASGKFTNWSQLGLPAGPIKLYAGSRLSGAGEGFDELVLKPRGLTLAARATQLQTDAELSDAVARDRRAIGITSLAFLRNAKSLAIADDCAMTTAPSIFSVKSEEYPLGRRLYLYSKGLADNSVARGLLTFAGSQTAQASVQTSQFIDQSIELSDFVTERARFDRAIKGALRETEREQARAVTAALKGARRLSATLRFASGSSQLDAKARDDVARVRELLVSPALRGKTALFVGYTDSIGSAKANRDLSYRRAVQIRDAVLGERPAGKAPVVVGGGTLAPVACDATDNGQRLNRRVEVWLRD